MGPCGHESLSLGPAPEEVAFGTRSRRDVGRPLGLWICPKDVDLIIKEVEHFPFVELCVGALDSYEANNGIGKGEDRDREGSGEPGAEGAAKRRSVYYKGEHGWILYGLCSLRSAVGNVTLCGSLWTLCVVDDGRQKIGTRKLRKNTSMSMTCSTAILECWMAFEMRSFFGAFYTFRFRSRKSGSKVPCDNPVRCFCSLCCPIGGRS